MTATSPLTASHGFATHTAVVSHAGPSAESGQLPFGDYLSMGVEESAGLAGKAGNASGPKISSRGSRKESGERKAGGASAAAGLATPIQPPANQPAGALPIAASDVARALLAPVLLPIRAGADDQAPQASAGAETGAADAVLSNTGETAGVTPAPAAAPLPQALSATNQELPPAPPAGYLVGGVAVAADADLMPSFPQAASNFGAQPADQSGSGGAVAAADRNLMASISPVVSSSGVAPAADGAAAAAGLDEAVLPQAAAKGDVKPRAERPGSSRASQAKMPTPRAPLFRGLSVASQELPQTNPIAHLTGAGLLASGRDHAQPAAPGAAASSPAPQGASDGAVAAPDQRSPRPLSQAAGDFRVPLAAPDGLAVAIRLEPQSDAHAARPGKDAPASVAERTPLPREIQPVEPHDAANGNPAQDSSARAGLWTPREVSSPGAPHQAAEPSANPVKSLDLPDPRVEPGAHPPAGPLKDLSIQVGRTQQERVDLHLTERAGELRVAVRAADPEMAHTLRQTLPELVNRLEENGFRTEAWRPAGIVSGSATPNETRASSSHSPQGDPQQQSGGSQQQGGQRQHNQSERPKWVAELESSLDGSEER